MNIIPVIRDLVLRNQKALIPGFGSFVIVKRPAQLNKVTRVITPPTTTVKFDRNQHHDDGQLSGYLVQKLKQSKEVAMQAISDFIATTDVQLKEKGVAVLEGFGTLNTKKSGDIGFTPEEELAKRIALFELPKMTVPGPPAEKAVVTPVHTPEFPQVTVKRRSRWWIPAAVLLLIAAGLLAVIYSTGNMDELISDVKAIFGVQAEKDTDQLVFGNQAGSEGQGVADTAKDQISRELDERMSREKALAIEEPEPAAPVVQSTPEIVLPAATADKPYQIIAGSFTDSGNAEKQKAFLERKGFAPVILPKRGKYYMVTLGSYDTPQQAASAMQQMEEKLQKELWVMKK